MTWIKPSFLWMMYRCDWAAKEGQERVLAIDMKRDAFDYLVNHAVYSKYDENSGISKDEWKSMVQKSDIRGQWDPERDKYGNPLAYRSIQLGICGDCVKKYVDEWIVNISDITDYAVELREKISKGEDKPEDYPQEKEYNGSIRT